MACLVLVGVVTVLLNPEPEGSKTAAPRGERPALAWINEVVIEPFRDFLERNGLRTALVILAFISLYKASDVLIAQMAFPFYLDVGFNELEIGWVSGTFGLFCTFGGSFLMGAMIYRFGIVPGLFVAGLLQMASNLMFALQAYAGARPGALPRHDLDRERIGRHGHDGLRRLPQQPLQRALHGGAVRAADVVHAAARQVPDHAVLGLPGRLDGLDPFFLLSMAAGLPALALLWWLWRHLPAPEPAAAGG